jgi:hypothetical protein
MNVPTAPQQAAAAPWTFRPLAHALPQGLPVGALTLISLPNQSVRRGPWSTVVGQLLLDMLDRSLPALYTYADDPYAACWPEEGCNPLGPHYVSVPDWCCGQANNDHVPGHCDAGLTGVPMTPTLENVAAALSEHEHWHGSSLVVIDNWNGARLHLDAETDDAVEPPSACHRASHLAAYAATRPAAPTAAVWNRRPAQTPDEAALTDVALLHITAQESERRRLVRLTVRTRQGADAPWSAGLYLVLPWFDWGFDDRDLDLEDSQFQALPDPWAR